MPPLSDPQALPWVGWFRAAAQAEVSGELAALYSAITEEVARRSPQCWISGRCCRFESYGHRLYVSGLETAWMIRNLEPGRRERWWSGDPAMPEGCVFQENGLCSVHALRPLGCRLFFCDPGAEAWLNDVHEFFLARLRRLHETHRVDYRYLEWRQALQGAREAAAGGMVPK